MATILTVLRTGPWHNGHIPCDYRPEHVQWLARQFQRFAPGHDFACLSDVKIPGTRTIPLRYDWPGWWSKMELFREDFGPVVYVDLDVVVVGDMTGILDYPHRFTSWCAPGRGHRVQSSVMAWSGYRPDLFETFLSRPQHWMTICTTPRCWGDQGFINRKLRGQWDELGQLFPGAVGSYHLDFDRGDPLPDTRLVVFHGSPRPWEVCDTHPYIPPFPC